MSDPFTKNNELTPDSPTQRCCRKCGCKSPGKDSNKSPEKTAEVPGPTDGWVDELVNKHKGNSH